MAKPLRSEDPNPKSVQFRHFGPLDTGKSSKGATITSLVLNGTALALILILSAMVKNNPTLANKVSSLILPPEPKPLPKPKPPPPPPPPKPLPRPPEIKEPPRIKPPEPRPIPPDIKPVVVATPRPVVLTPPAPKRINPPPAPKYVNLSQPKAASIANNDAHPSAVRLGNPEIKALNGPPVATSVNLGGGMHGMPPSNTGSGPHAASVNLGNGSPQGTDLNGRGRGPTPVKGLSNGYGNNPNGRGAYRGPQAVEIAPPSAREATRPLIATALSQAKAPVLIYKPTPVYTEEARSQHIEGSVRVRIHVSATGQTQYLGLSSHLGGGLDKSAEDVARGMRFRPALDASGQPTDWTGDVLVTFQLS
jgi:protein TonB